MLSYSKAKLRKMKQASVKQYLKLRQQLVAERNEILARLKEVEAALGAVSALPQPAKVSAVKVKVKRAGKRARNSLSLKDAVVKVVTGKALTKADILKGVEKLGYKFSTKKPENSLGVILYGKKPKFKNNDGKFSLA